MTKRRSRNFWGWLFVLPTVIGLIVLNIYPMLNTIWQSFHRVGDFGREAASIDGATPTQQFLKITVPLISPTIFFVTVTRVISGMQVFDSIFMIMGMGTGGNPALPRTQSLVYLFYRYAFMQRNWGVGSAIVVFLLVIIALITAVQMIAQKKWVHYN